MNSCSHSPALVTGTALELGDQPLDAGELKMKGLLDARGDAFTVRYLANMLPTQVQFPGNAAKDSGAQLRSVQGGIHIVWKRDNETVTASRSTKLTICKVTNSRQEKCVMVTGSDSGALPAAIKQLRKDHLHLTQTKFAQMLGVSLSTVAKWEAGEVIPSRMATLRLSEVAPPTQRQWWRDLAADQLGLDVNTKRDNLSVTIDDTVTTIPIVKDAAMLSNTGALHSADIEVNLSFPQSWFPVGGIIRAVRTTDSSISPLAEGDVIVLIDISRRDADRIVDRIVAFQTAEGIDLARLRKIESSYILMPLREGGDRQPRVLRMHGENSIVGQVVKWISDATPYTTGTPQLNKPKPAQSKVRRLRRWTEKDDKQ